MTLVLITGPAVEPVTAAEAKAHARVDTTADDTLITALIVAAREIVEQITRRALITQTWDYILDEWPAGDTIVVPLPPLQSVTSVKYTDDDGNILTLSSGDYVVDSSGEPGRIRLKSSASWPSDTLREVNGVQVRFAAGYGAAGSNVPQAIRQAMLLLIGHWYENREVVISTGAMPKELPFAVEALLWPYRVLRWL